MACSMFLPKSQFEWFYMCSVLPKMHWLCGCDRHRHCVLQSVYDLLCRGLQAENRSIQPKDLHNFFFQKLMWFFDLYLTYRRYRRNTARRWAEVNNAKSSVFTCFVAEGRSEEHTSELQSRFDLVC